MIDLEQLHIFRDNLLVFSERKERAHAQRRLCVSEVIDRHLKGESPDSRETLYEFLRTGVPELSKEERALFFLRLVEGYPRRNEAELDRSFYPWEEEGLEDSRGRIALVKNRYNEQAFQQLAPLVVGAKEYHVSSFSEACEEVASNRCEFCILPLENDRDGRLFGFYGMLDRYEMKVCAVTSLETEEPLGSTRYALSGRSLPSRIAKQSQWNLEFSIASPVGEFPHDVLAVASLLQAILLKVDSLPVLYDDQLQRFYFTFRAKKTNAHAFHLYCSAEHSRYTPIGLYPVL